jgi:hypothetical protein
MKSKIMTTQSFANLPDTIFCNIFEYLDWGDAGRFDNALLNRKMRISYLDAVKIRKVKVERIGFWMKALDRGILSWLISWLIRRNIRVISWDLKVNNAQLISIASGLPQLQSLNIRSNNIITEEELRALVVDEVDISSALSTPKSQDITRIFLLINQVNIPL